MATTALTGQAATVLGPLTTTFTPPAECTVAVGGGRGGFLGGLFGGQEKDVAYLGQLCSRNRAADATTCWPPTSDGAEEKSAPLSGWGFYSPGLHCPAGYATACSATGGSGGKSDWPVQFRLGDGETAVGCCPSGYGCANMGGQTCIMVATSTTVPTVTCRRSEMSDVTSQAVPDDKASIDALSLFAPMIQINWQSSDRSESTTTGASTRSTDTTTTATSDPSSSTAARSTATGTSPSSSSATGPDDNQKTASSTETSSSDGAGGSATEAPSLHEPGASSDSGGGLSSSVKVVLGIAGAGAALLMAVCAMFYCWRRRESRREEQELDRLYGMKRSTSPTGDFTATDDIPGWYRGQRPVAPAHDPFRDGPGAIGQPAASYYRPYRQ